LTQAEYQNLLKQSPTFREFSENTQQAILMADPEHRANYMRIFTEELVLLRAEAEILLKKNDEIIAKAQYEAKKSKLQPMLNQEKQSSTTDLQDAEQLLQNL
jgi:hypothetical protein